MNFMSVLLVKSKQEGDSVSGNSMVGGMNHYQSHECPLPTLNSLDKHPVHEEDATFVADCTFLKF